MTDTEYAMLRAVAAAPEDDTRRLALADYWDENDNHSRAEFVRAAVRLPGVPNRRVLDCRFEQLPHLSRSDPLSWRNQVAVRLTGEFADIKVGGVYDLRDTREYGPTLDTFGCVLLTIPRGGDNRAYFQVTGEKSERMLIVERLNELHNDSSGRWLHVRCPECRGLSPSGSPCAACNSTGDIGGLSDRGFYAPGADEEDGLSPIDTRTYPLVRWDRGFPAAVFCRLPNVLSDIWPFRLAEPPKVRPWALRLVTWHPIAEIICGDKAPYPNGAGVAWYSTDRDHKSPHVPPAAELPRAVLDELDGHLASQSDPSCTDPGGGRWKAYKFEPEAVAALARALARLVRKAVPA